MTKRSIDAIQALRGIAATMVVMHHTIRAYWAKAESGQFAPANILADRTRLEFLMMGVDIFFVISGFIMVYTVSGLRASPSSAPDFLARRVIRVFPLYWLVTAIPVCGALFVWVKTGWADEFVLSTGRLLGSVTLFPTYNAKGLPQPIVGVGWTLSYELLFYLLFAAAMMARQRVAVVASALLIATLFFARAFLAPGTAIADFLRDPVYLEFVYGCAIGYLFKAGLLPRLPLIAAPLALAAAIGCSVLQVPDVWRFAHLGVPAAIIVAVALSHSPAVLKSKAILNVGDASYSIYLLHLTLLYSLAIKPLQIVPRFTESGWAIDLLIVLTFCACCVGGWFLYRFVERPLTDRLTYAYKTWAAQRRRELGRAGP